VLLLWHLGLSPRECGAEGKCRGSAADRARGPGTGPEVDATGPTPRQRRGWVVPSIYSARRPWGNGGLQLWLRCGIYCAGARRTTGDADWRARKAERMQRLIASSVALATTLPTASTCTGG
jgi:hypothetical protein